MACALAVIAALALFPECSTQELTHPRLKQLWKAVNPGGDNLPPKQLREALSAIMCEDGAKFTKVLAQIVTFGLATTKRISDGMKLPNVTQRLDIVERRVADIAIRLLFSHRTKPGAPAVST